MFSIVLDEHISFVVKVESALYSSKIHEQENGTDSYSMKRNVLIQSLWSEWNSNLGGSAQPRAGGGASGRESKPCF